MMHLAMVSTNGTVWDISLNEKSSPSKLYLLKLPQSCTYNGYSDAKGILNFINGNLKKKLIQYHSSFSKKGHKTVVKKKYHKQWEIILLLIQLAIHIAWLLGHPISWYLFPMLYSEFAVWRLLLVVWQHLYCWSFAKSWSWT